jgi:uncharacterized protein
VFRITADTNIIISSLNFVGIPREIFNLAEVGVIRLAVSDDILDEVAHVLRRPKFAWPEAEIERALTQISRFAERVAPNEHIEVITSDPADNRILECAVASGSEYLVTGDRHLLELGQFAGIEIMKPANFLQMLARAREGR